MRKLCMLLVVACMLGCTQGFGQDQKVYVTSSVEYLLSWSNVKDNGKELTGPVRFAPFFNWQNTIHKDLSEKFGLFLGLSVNNVGFIYDVDATTHKKVRTYNLGIPIGFKVGKMNGTYFFGGYAVEFPLNYKEKTFVSEQKSKFNTWFSDRTNIQQSVTAGIQLPYGATIKLRYYLTDFYNKNYVGSDGQGGTTKPYANFSGNAIVLSLGAVLFKGTEFTYK